MCGAHCWGYSKIVFRILLSRPVIEIIGICWGLIHETSWSRMGQESDIKNREFNAP
jgi:hypothetical protein